MENNLNINTINHEELIALYNKIKDFISYLDNEIETSQVEKTTKK